MLDIQLLSQDNLESGDLCLPKVLETRQLVLLMNKPQVNFPLLPFKVFYTPFSLYRPPR